MVLTTKLYHRFPRESSRLLSLNIDVEAKGNDEYVLDDVLSLEGWHQGSRPSGGGEEEEGGEGHKYVWDEEGESGALHFGDDEESADRHLEYAEEDDELAEAQKGQGFLKEGVNERVGRAFADQLERSEPGIDEEEGEARE